MALSSSTSASRISFKKEIKGNQHHPTSNIQLHLSINQRPLNLLEMGLPRTCTILKVGFLKRKQKKIQSIISFEYRPVKLTIYWNVNIYCNVSCQGMWMKELTTKFLNKKYCSEDRTNKKNKNWWLSLLEKYFKDARYLKLKNYEFTTKLCFCVNE